MLKKVLLIVLVLFCGCSKSLKTDSGYSRTYLFFKDFDTNNYYVSFYDRNVSVDDKTKINMARSSDNYFYEIDGFENRIIIQKDGFRYTVNNYNKDGSKIYNNRRETERLREEYGFDGYFVSDFFALNDIHENHKVTSNKWETAALALEITIPPLIPAAGIWKVKPSVADSSR